MPQFPPERLMIEDERSKALFFKLISHRPKTVHTQFALDELLTTWFNNEPEHLARFLEWLDDYGLEIKNKQ